MFKKKFFALTIALLIFSSCKKEALDNTALLTSGKWRITADIDNGVDHFRTALNCEKDNTWQFETSGIITIDEGATKCSASDQQSYSIGRWLLSGTDQKKLIITEDTGSGSSTTLDIVELTSGILKITYTDAGHTYVITFVKV